ncbi:localization factor PodJL [Phyllobacterium brassicacearum]|nr:localization factor PodJL [Phyllobacterium brassicacearum]
MEQVNVNRARRDATSLDSLNRTLETLEGQLRRAMEPRPNVSEESQDIADRFAALASRAGRSAAPKHVMAHPAPETTSQRSDGKHDLSAIAAQLKQLRDEMRDEIEPVAPARFEPHVDAMNRLRQTTATASDRFVNASASRPDTGHLSMLRGDLEELRRTVDTLAREESVRNLGNRWDAMDERFDAFTQRNPFNVEEASLSLGSLEGRLKEIRETLDGLPQSLPLKNVEDKLLLLASAVDQMSRKNGASLTGKFMQQVDERLDEISRAIVATSRPSAIRNVEADAFERLEARITSLATKIETATLDRTSDTILKRMGELAERVDYLTAQHAAPIPNLDVLSEQLAAITRHLQNEPASISITDFRDLEDRVLQIIDKLENMPQPTAAAPAFLEQIDQRFDELTRRLDDHHMMVEHSDIRLTDNLEARFDDIARYIAKNVPEVDSTHDAIRNLELQIAGLAQHLSQSNDQHAELRAIPPRLDAIEESIALNRDLVLEAARNAAAEAIRNTASFDSAHDSMIARELADDLKTLERLARKSEERNSKTFEAIHDTLLKIVDRLASLESGHARVHSVIGAVAEGTIIAEHPQDLAYDPNLNVEPAHVASRSNEEEISPEVTLAGDAEIADHAPRERKSLFGSIARGLKGRSKQEATPLDPGLDVMSDVGKSDVKMDFDPDILNRPLEPGSGMPDLNSILKRVRDDRRVVPHASDATAGKADFIAAARRAAQAAASEVESQKRSSADSEEAGAAKGGLFSRQRKPILLAIGAIMIAIAGLQLKSAFLDHPALPDVTASQAQPAEPVAIASYAPEVGPTEAPLEASTRPGLAASQPAPDSVASVIAAQQNTPSTIAATDASTPPTAIEPATVIPAVPVEAGPDPLRAAASNGDPKALFEIGDRYMDGRGLERDYAKAAEWYSVAAEQGFAPAQYRLGNFYEKGLGLTRDLAKAKTYYQLAAEQGNASAMHNLAVLFAAGTDGAPDNESAALWFAKAAELGVKDSQFNLAVLSAKGMGVQQNLEESYKWFALAANAGDKDAAQKRDEVAKAMPSEQLQRARAAVELWKPKPMNPDTNALHVPEAWRESPVTTGSIDMEKAIRNVQLILNKNGYDAGGSDGKIGSKTRDAIMAFQKDNGLKPTGNIDGDFVRNLLKKNG